MWCELGGQVHPFACGCPAFPTPFVDKTVLSTLSGLGTRRESLFLGCQLRPVDPCVCPCAGPHC